MSILHRDHGLVQVPGDVQAASLQAAGVNSIHHPTEFSVSAISPAVLSWTELDTIDIAYRVTFSAFNTLLCGITIACLKRWYSSVD